MSFSIESLLEKKTNSNGPRSTDSAEGAAGQNGAVAGALDFPWNSDPAGPDNPTVPAQMLPPTLANQQLPSLADLQLLFGGGGPKAHYRRNRRSGADRKPRQAYSSKQLEKLEDEFKKDKYLSVSKRVELSKTLNLTETQIKTWFQNRRTKWKKQVTASLRQLYRHGLYSQYAAAAVAAVANPSACFLPMVPHGAPAIYDGYNSMGQDQHQIGGTTGTVAPPWGLPGNSFVSFAGTAPIEANDDNVKNSHQVNSSSASLTL